VITKKWLGMVDGSSPLSPTIGSWQLIEQPHGDFQEYPSCHPIVADVVELPTRYLGAHEVFVAAGVLLVDGLSSDRIAGMNEENDVRVGRVIP
jgi:hypothetical protein